MLLNALIISHAAHGGQRSDRRPALANGDRVQAGKPRQVDEGVRAFDFAFGKVEKCRAPGQQHRARVPGKRCGLVEAGCAGIIEVHHAAASAALRTADTILG